MRGANLLRDATPSVTVGRSATPLLTMSLLRRTLNIRMPPAQEQTARRTNARANQAKIGGRVE